MDPNNPTHARLAQFIDVMIRGLDMQVRHLNTALNCEPIIAIHKY